MHLVGAVQNVELGEEGRQTAAVLLRRLLSAEFFEFFPKLPFEQQAMLREQLLLSLQMDISQQLRRKVCAHYNNNFNEYKVLIKNIIFNSILPFIS